MVCSSDVFVNIEAEDEGFIKTRPCTFPFRPVKREYEVNPQLIIRVVSYVVANDLAESRGGEIPSWVAVTFYRILFGTARRLHGIIIDFEFL